jgi:enamine deaminase RidA (YjgF/YER057c/UK114 family)
MGEADQNLKQALKAARLSERQILFRNEYGTTPGATIPMRELPDQMQAAISVIAAKKTNEKTTRDSPTICRADGNTIFCTAQAGIGDSGKTVQDQVKQVMQKLYAGLEKHGANLSHVTASNVYLDDIREFRPMNETYATFFSGAPPTRTTVQPCPAADRAEGNPALVRISVTAVKE